MTVVELEEDAALELAPEAGAEELSQQLSSGDDDEETEDDDEEEEDEETDSEGNGGGGAPPLKKGPWTPEEDKRLKDYVEAHGEGNWNQVQRNAGLNRCGKSCRLRWANHLRPDLKKGPFDAEEVDKIIRFHIMWGNKWAKMASHDLTLAADVHLAYNNFDHGAVLVAVSLCLSGDNLICVDIVSSIGFLVLLRACHKPIKLPGRTDNEIKNYWNTRLKRHQRAGLPIYPEYLLSRVPDQDMNCHTPDESRGKKRSNELPQEKVVGMDDLVGDFMVFQHLDYGKDPVVPTNPLKRHASTGDLSCLQIPVNTEKTFYSNDLYYVLTKSQSMPLGSAIASGYPIFDGNLSTSGTIHGSMKTELPSFQSSKCDFSNGWLLQCPSASIEQQIDTFIQSPESMSSHNTGLLGRIINKGDVLDDPTKSERFFEMAVPLGYNIVSKSNDYPMRHPSSSVNGDCEPDACLFPETQDSNSPSGGSDAIFTLGKCYPDGNFPVAGMPSLEASFFNADSLLKDQSYLYPSGSLFDEEPCEEPKPLIDAGQWLDSTVWKSVPGASNMPDFTGP